MLHARSQPIKQETWRISTSVASTARLTSANRPSPQEGSSFSSFWASQRQVSQTVIVVLLGAEVVWFGLGRPSADHIYRKFQPATRFGRHVTV